VPQHVVSPLVQGHRGLDLQVVVLNQLLSFGQELVVDLLPELGSHGLVDGIEAGMSPGQRNKMDAFRNYFLHAPF
jgi:hypothetical protein